MKRGQVTVFIILGVVMVALTAISFFYFSQEGVVEKITPIETTSIKFFVDNCLHKTTEEAIINNGKHGGYFELPSSSTHELFENLPYYDDKIPSVHVIAEQMVRYVDASLLSCIHGFDIFQEYNISFQHPKSTAAIKHNKLLLKTMFPLSIVQNKKEVTMSKFEVSLPVNKLVDTLNLGAKIARTKRDSICLSCFADDAKNNNIGVQIMNLPNGTLLIDLTNRHYVVGDNQYVLRFALRESEIDESDFELK